MYRENALDPATLLLSFPKEKKEIKKERKNFLLTHIKSFPFLLKKKEETRTKTKTNTRRDKIPFFLLSEIGSFGFQRRTDGGDGLQNRLIPKRA